MPGPYFASPDNLAAVIVELEAKGERVCASTIDAANNYTLFTTRGPGRPKGEKETR